MKITVLISALLVSTLIWSQESFSIADAENYGVNNHEKVKNSYIDAEKAQKQIWETTAIGLPQVSGEITFQQFLDIPVQVVDATLFNPAAPPGSTMEFQMGQEFSGSASLKVNQLLFDGSYIVGLQFSRFYKEVSEKNIQRTQVEVKELVREAYYNVLVAQKNVDIMDSILISTEKLQKENQVLYENGFILKSDADQIQLALNRIVANKMNAERQLVIAYNLLKMQMGYDLSKEIQLTQTLDEVLEEILTNSPVEQGGDITSNNNYQMLTDQKTMDEYALRNEKMKYYPSVGAFLQYSQNAYRSEFDFFDSNGNWFPTTVWGIGVQIPITTSGQKIVKVQQAELQLDQDQNNLDNLQRSLEFQELQLKAQFQTAYDQMQLEKQNVELARFIYEQALTKKSIGSVSSLEVTQLQNQLLQAEGTYIATIMQVLNAKIALDKLYSK